MMLHPDPVLQIMPGIDVNLVMPLDTISIFIMARHPNTFPSLRDPLSVNLPVARGFEDGRKVMIDMSFIDLIWIQRF